MLSSSKVEMKWDCGQNLNCSADATQIAVYVRWSTRREPQIDGLIAITHLTVNTAGALGAREHCTLQPVFAPGNVNLDAASCSQPLDGSLRPGLRQRREQVNLTLV